MDDAVADTSMARITASNEKRIGDSGT